MAKKTFSEEDTDKLREVLSEYINNNKSVSAHSFHRYLDYETNRMTVYNFINNRIKNITVPLAESIVRYFSQLTIKNLLPDHHSEIIDSLDKSYNILERKRAPLQESFNDFIQGASDIEAAVFFWCEATAGGANGDHIRRLGQYYINAINKLLVLKLIEPHMLTGELFFKISNGYEVVFPKIEIWRKAIVAFTQHIKQLDKENIGNKRKLAVLNLNDQGVKYVSEGIDHARSIITEVHNNEKYHGNKPYFVFISFDTLEKEEEDFIIDQDFEIRKKTG